MAPVVICLVLCDFTILSLSVSFVQCTWCVGMSDTLFDVARRELCEFFLFGSV